MTRLMQMAKWKLGETDDAIEDMKHALEVDARDATASFYKELGFRLRNLHAYDQALAAYGKAGQLDPNLLDIYESRGSLFDTQGLYEKSLAEFNRVIELAPRRSWAYKRRARSHFRLERYDEALGDLQKALEFNSNDASCVFWLDGSRVAACPDEAFREGMFKLANRAVDVVTDARGLCNA